MTRRTIRLALACCALTGCTQAVAAATEQPVPIKVTTVAADSGRNENRYSGTLEPAVHVDMAFRVAGYVEAIGEPAAREPSRGQHGPSKLDKGDRVSKGTLLARLRSTEYVQKRSTAEAQVSEARASQRLAADELVRAQRLFDSGAITQAELDVKRAHAESAGAQLAAARARADEAALAVSDTILRAPLEGVVLARNIEVGSLVAAGQPAFSLVDTRSVKAVFGAPEALVEELQIGRPLQVFVAADSSTPHAAQLTLDARVSRIAPAADGAGRVFSVEAELQNASGELRAGSVISVRVPAVRRAHALSVPLGTIVRSARDPRGFAVFVLPGDEPRGVVEQRDVMLGEVVGNAVTVTAGLHGGERIVSMGASLLRDGTDAVIVH